MALRDEILTVNLILTRRCNLRCSYCRIIKNYDEYVAPAFQSAIKTLSDWKEIISTIYSLNPYVFLIFTGGEVLTAFPFGDFVELVRWLGQFASSIRPIPYAFISNSLLLTESKARKLVEAGLLNWSTSVDSLEEIPFDKDIGKKSHAGLKWLLWFKEHGVKDLVAIITCTKANYHEAPEIIRRLSNLGIWSRNRTTVGLKPGKFPSTSFRVSRSQSHHSGIET